MEHKIISLASGTESRPASDNLRDRSSSSETHFGLWNNLVFFKPTAVFWNLQFVLADSRPKGKELEPCNSPVVEEDTEYKKTQN